MAVYYAQNGNPTPFVHGDGERNSQRWSEGVKPRKYTERDTFYPQHIRGSGQRIFRSGRWNLALRYGLFSRSRETKLERQRVTSTLRVGLRRPQRKRPR